MVPYPEVTVRKRFSKCTKKNFLAYGHLLEIRCQEHWTNQKPRYKLKSAVVCQQRPLVAVRPPQKKHRPNFTDEELHDLIDAVIPRKEVLFSKFGGKIKFGDYRAIVRKAAGKKKMLVGLVNITI